MWVVKLIVVAVILAAVYLTACVFDPWTRCRRKHCEGGRVYTGDRQNWHDCWRCKGSGKRRRFGRWVLDKMLERRRARRG